MDRQSLRVLEFPLIQRFLQSLTVTGPGWQRAETLQPITVRHQIEVWLGQVTELKKYLQIGKTLPLGGIVSLGPMLDGVRETGQALTPHDLLDVGSTLGATRSLHKLIDDCRSEYPKLADLLVNLQPRADLEPKIQGAIDSRGGIRDDASPELARIRKEIWSVRQRLHEELTEILEQQASQKRLQEKLVSVRNDRLVIPFRSDARAAVEGIVHDTSQSGATCFVEPLSVVPINNQLSQARSQEREEQIRILRELTDEVMAVEEVLRDNEIWLGWIDCVHAKVRLSVLLQAREPILNDGDSIRLLQASHPILALQEKALQSSGLPAPLAELVSGSDLLETNTANKVDVVPIDLVLSEEQKTLIISGANTGGKTVSLKTLGLLGAMVQAGLHIPVAEGSEWPVLSDIFAEIGDEQDVLAHLSTFSARVQTLVKMLAQVDRKSLFLLDEIGTGTDPAEGTALALAVLDELRQQEPFIVVTTHYHLIKAYGMLQQTVENVSVAFDEESGKPTYRLQYGHAGTSNALQIAADLGMPLEIIEAAKNHLDRDEGRTIDLIRQLGQAWQRANSEAEELRRQREQWELARADLAREHSELVQAREAILTEVRHQTEGLLSETEKELKSVISSLQKGGMREAMGAREKVQRIREDLDSSLKSQVQHTSELVTAAAVGKPVKLRGTDGSGTLLRLKDQGRRAEVQIGPKLVEVGTEALELLSVQHKRNDKGVHLDGIRLIRDEPDTYQQRLNLVGLRVEEALPLLDKAIDRAILEGCNQIHVVHGRGTGRLRQAVQNFLAEHAVVKGFRPEEQSQGGTGVTVVDLKD